MDKFVYSGTHTGDHLTVKQAQRLELEIRRLSKLDVEGLGLSAEERRDVDSFFREILRLVKASQKVNKPIAF